VRHEKRSLDGTSVRVGSVPVEDLLKNIVIANVNGIVKGQSNHLRDIGYKKKNFYSYYTKQQNKKH